MTHGFQTQIAEAMAQMRTELDVSHALVQQFLPFIREDLDMTEGEYSDQDVWDAASGMQMFCHAGVKVWCEQLASSHTL